LISRIRIWLVAFSLLIAANNARGLSDSSKADAASRVIDPASNRLFWMSTGNISKPHHFSIGWFEFLLIQFGYTPTDFLQLNLSGTGGYFSVGTKARLLPPLGIFRGLAAGADFDYFPSNPKNHRGLVFYTLATGFGLKSVEAHGAVSSPSLRQTSDSQALVQGGISVLVSGDSTGLKLIAVWANTIEGLKKGELATWATGFRAYSNTFVAELALMTIPSLSFGHATGRERLSFVPYFSLMWFLANH
jgi:hypothetical protein